MLVTYAAQQQQNEGRL